MSELCRVGLHEWPDAQRLVPRCRHCGARSWALVAGPTLVVAAAAWRLWR